MGACKSRQQKPNYAINQKLTAKQETAPVFRAPPGLENPRARSQGNLRADAQPFIPKTYETVATTEEDEGFGGDKEAWELFLDKKKTEVGSNKNAPIRADVDGYFTSKYRTLLSDSKYGGNQKRPPWKKDEARERDFDILVSWRNAAPRVKPAYLTEPQIKKRKATPLKKQILAQREEAPPHPLWTKFAEHLQRFKEDQNAPKVEKRMTKDDLSGEDHGVPFGLADRCYMSDTEDSGKAHRHVETSHCAVREYVDMCLTPELESAVTACLYRLRQLKMQDIGIGQKTRRYAVGFREVARLLQHKSVSALIIAPDVEKTSAGALEDKVMGLKNQCDHDGVPVIFALSRRQLGAAIQKNVTISVLAIQEIRGAEELFQQMIMETNLARELNSMEEAENQ
jgi:ribosomal protein L7Ae-like RNA K-turn-binding protein